MGWLDSPKTVLAAVWRIVRAAVTAPVRIPKRLWELAGGARGATIQTKVTAAVAVVLALVTGAGVLFAMTTDIELSASSAPIITGVLAWVTTGWGYVLAALVFGQGTVWGIRRRLIGQAAAETGYAPRTIARLADEIRTTDATTRAIVFGDDDAADARERIRESFAGQADRISLNRDGGRDLTPAIERVAGGSTADDGDADDADLSLAERFKLWRMDTASAVQTDAVVWRFGVPAAVVLVLELVLVRFWIQWYLYIPLLAGAVLAGLLFYKATNYVRGRRLRQLRADHGRDFYEQIAVLVKTVETDELTVHMGFLAGRSYAHTDREALVDTLATRALQRAQGQHPAPAIEERYAWCLERYIPTFENWRVNREEPAIMDALVNEALDAEEGLLPKDELAERVIEHDRERAWFGLRFVGLGYDPDLVRECYTDLVPNTLVEQDLHIEDAQAGERTETAVRTRTETLPADIARLRASFSERFPARGRSYRYDLPVPTTDDDTRGHVITASRADD